MSKPHKENPKKHIMLSSQIVHRQGNSLSKTLVAQNQSLKLKLMCQKSPCAWKGSALSGDREQMEMKNKHLLVPRLSNITFGVIIKVHTAQCKLHLTHLLSRHQISPNPFISLISCYTFFPASTICF